MRLIDADKLFYDFLKMWGTEVEADSAIAAMFMQTVNDASTIAPPPDDPLTPEELREMGGEPYYHVGLQDDSQAPHWAILDPFHAKHIEDYGYGKWWLAYRRKPEEAQNWTACL